MILVIAKDNVRKFKDDQRAEAQAFFASLPPDNKAILSGNDGCPHCGAGRIWSGHIIGLAPGTIRADLDDIERARLPTDTLWLRYAAKFVNFREE